MSQLLVFADVMRRLRAECPWKQAQTHRSLARYLLEEAHETAEALDLGDAALLREELGDLLLQVYFHAVIAEESGAFTLEDVAGDVVAKMVRRNPHVFGEGGEAADASRETVDRPSVADVEQAWEAAKAAEKQRSSVLDGIAPTLPALLRADKVLDRLARAGADPAEVVVADAGDADAPVGERLLALVAEARRTGLDPEQELRDAVRRAVGDG